MIAELQPNVHHVKYSDRDIILVGTAHVSNQSAELVKQVIAEYKPDCIAVELCEARFRSLRDPERWKSTNLVTVIRQGKAYALLAQIILAAYQRKLGDQFKIKPGAEMLVAADLADEAQIPCVMADRDINITLRRTWGSLGISGILRLSMSILRSMLVKHGDITAEEIERLKQSDALEEVMKEFSQALPEVRTALIDERDQFLTHKIREAPGKKVVAVIGAAHVPGILRWINQPIDSENLTRARPKSIVKKLAGWAIPILFLAAMIISFYTTGGETFSQMFRTWFWFTALFAALGAAIVRAHPLTTLSAFISAPFASLNPFVAAGWVAGLVEAVVRKPRVGDLERIMDDLQTYKGMLNNRVSRTLLIVASTNLFTMLGMAVAGVQVYQIATDAHASRQTIEAKAH